MNKKVSILLLNYNGWNDTIDCIKSILKEGNVQFNIIIVDNGSGDNSVNNILTWLKKNNVSNSLIKASELGKRVVPNFSHKEVLLIQSFKNLGFAAGNNLAIQLAIQIGSEFLFILNNDTILEDGAILKLFTFLNEHQDYAAVTPQIRYFDQPSIIWNCGGRLIHYFGRKYYYAEKNIRELPNYEYINISFITGCALFIRSSIFEFNPIGFIEDFFFGEEDFELSVRLRKRKFKIACLLHSIIYHKVSSSIGKYDVKEGKIYIHYLNRFIHLRRYYSFFIWRLICYSYLIKLFFTLKIKLNFKFADIYLLFCKVLKNSKVLTRVSYEHFHEAFKV